MLDKPNIKYDGIHSLWEDQAWTVIGACWLCCTVYVCEMVMCKWQGERRETRDL